MSMLRERRTIAAADRTTGEAGPVPRLVATRATERAEDVAVVTGDQRLTYGELDTRATHLAHHLRGLGVGRDVLVGLCLPRSSDMVVAALAILKAGGAYVPLDPSSPPDRLAFALNDAAAPVLITNSRLAPELARGTRASVVMDAWAPSVADAGQATFDPLPDPAPTDLAYVIYTSGSTGTPKGVAVSHEGLTNLVEWHNDAFAVTARDRASHVAGLGFDAAVWELWPYLVAGASVYLADDLTRTSADDLREWLLARRITIAFIPTPLAERLLASTAPWPSTTALRLVLTGGDTLHRYPAPGLPFTLVNNYGPTETTVVATSGPVAPNAAPSAPPTIGRPIANTRVYLLDDQLRPVAPGEAGEICVGGPGVARGYVNRPDLTAAKFVPDPFSIDPGARLYRTGDVGRLLANGEIAFLGRTDDQIKIRGYRIEPGEIASLLDTHREIAASVVVAHRDGPDDVRLVAYVASDSRELTPAGLRAFLADRLPDYMLPATFVRLDALPVTAHGKIDYAALPAPGPLDALYDDPETAPRTDTEAQIAEILCDLLHLDEIDVEDNFFMLGGHSLLGAQLIARLRDAFGVRIALRALFEAPTAAALAAEVERLTAEESSVAEAPLDVRRGGSAAIETGAPRT